MLPNTLHTTRHRKIYIGQATDHFVFGKNPEEKMKRESFLAIQSYNDLKNLLEKSDSDINLRGVLKELVERIISYTEATGEIFDFVGRDNIALYQKDGK